MDFIIPAAKLNKAGWKLYSMIFVSMAMSLNMITIMLVLMRVSNFHLRYDFGIDILPGIELDNILVYVLLYFLPPVLINYFLIFRNRRYETLFEKYSTSQGKLMLIYISTSYFLPIIVLIIDALYTKLFIRYLFG